MRPKVEFFISIEPGDWPAAIVTVTHFNEQGEWVCANHYHIGPASINRLFYLRRFQPVYSTFFFHHNYFLGLTFVFWGG